MALMSKLEEAKNPTQDLDDDADEEAKAEASKCSQMICPASCFLVTLIT